MKPDPDSTHTAVRQVACPSCGGPSVYAPANAWRPFCSERCKQLDLGAWASGQFAVAVPTEPDFPADNTPPI